MRRIYMKKSITINAIVITVFAMIFILCGVIAADHASAADEQLVTVEITTESAVEILTPMTITMDDAYKQMKSSDTWALIELSNLSDKGVAYGYSESISSLEKAQEAAETSSSFVSFDSSNLKQTKARKVYAKSMLIPNSVA